MLHVNHFTDISFYPVKSLFDTQGVRDLLAEKCYPKICPLNYQTDGPEFEPLSLPSPAGVWGFKT